MIEWSLGMTLADVERVVILKAFRFFQGNKTRTAAALDIAIRTLDSKLEQYGVKATNHGVVTYEVPAIVETVSSVEIELPKRKTKNEKTASR